MTGHILVFDPMVTNRIKPKSQLSIDFCIHLFKARLFNRWLPTASMTPVAICTNLVKSFARLPLVKTGTVTAIAMAVAATPSRANFFRCFHDFLFFCCSWFLHLVAMIRGSSLDTVAGFYKICDIPPQDSLSQSNLARNPVSRLYDINRRYHPG